MLKQQLQILSEKNGRKEHLRRVTNISLTKKNFTVRLSLRNYNWLISKNLQEIGIHEETILDKTKSRTLRDRNEFSEQPKQKIENR